MEKEWSRVIEIDSSLTLEDFHYPRILSWTRLSVRFSGSVAPTRKPGKLGVRLGLLCFTLSKVQ